jgi:hypothetical protein
MKVELAGRTNDGATETNAEEAPAAEASIGRGSPSRLVRLISPIMPDESGSTTAEIVSGTRVQVGAGPGRTTSWTVRKSVEVWLPNWATTPIVLFPVWLERRMAVRLQSPEQAALPPSRIETSSGSERLKVPLSPEVPLATARTEKFSPTNALSGANRRVVSSSIKVMKTEAVVE